MGQTKRPRCLPSSEISDAASGKTGTLRSARLRVHGEASSEDDSYYYTNEFASLGTGSRAQLTDSGDGKDTINAAAVTRASTINLNDGTTSTIAGQSLTISQGSAIENAIGGDGDDSLTGNALNNDLRGNRGNDTLDGGAGMDFLYGGVGDDDLTGDAGFDQFIIRKEKGQTNIATRYPFN